MEHDEQQVLVGCEVDERRAQQHITGEVERPSGQLAEQFAGPEPRLRSRQAAQIDDAELELAGPGPPHLAPLADPARSTLAMSHSESMCSGERRTTALGAASSTGPKTSKWAIGCQATSSVPLVQFS